MAANPIHGVLEKHTQVPRRLTPGERRALHRRAGSLPASPPVEVEKVTRMREVVVRQGQAEFRARLITAYDGTCAVTGTKVPEVLQAAHVEPYATKPSNLVTNGLLLRADIHDLFDRGLIWITPSLTIGVSPLIEGPEYVKLRGRKLRLPARVSDRPDKSRLAQHRRIIAGQPR